MNFEHVTLPQRVVFRSGQSVQVLAAEVASWCADRVLVVASSRARELAERLCAGIEVAAWFDDVTQHVPVEKVEAARALTEENGIDLLVCVGGGSAVGLAKAVALSTGIPIVAIPTTYAGSEATNVWGTSESQTKTTGVDNRVLPRTILYDAELTVSLPVELSVASGLNALAHCVDSLWAPGANPINQALALEGARAMALALPEIVLDPHGISGREQALYGCYLAAVAFGSARSGLHHKICHILGGTFDLPHAQTHAAVMPHVLALNARAVPELASRLATALGRPVAFGEDPAAAVVAALDALYERVDAPRRLADYDFTEADIPEAVARIVKAAPKSNPVTVTEENVTTLLTAALRGVPPLAVGGS